MEKSPFIRISVGVDILSSIFFPMAFRNPETRVCWLEAAVDRKQHRFPCPRISVAPYEINVFEVSCVGATFFSILYNIRIGW